MINPNQLGRRQFPASASQWMLVGLRGGAPPPVGLNDGDPVTTWTDSSGNGHTATQTGSARPTFKSAILNGKPVVRFTAAGLSGLNLATSISGVTPWSMFVVLKATSAATTCFSLAADQSCPMGLLENSDGLLYAFKRESGLSNTPGINYTTAFHVFSMDTSGNFSVDGSLIATNPIGITGSGNWVNIGYQAFAPQYSNGDIAEIIYYSALLPGTDRANLEKYLGTKYGITVAGGTAVDPSTVVFLTGWWKADSLGT